MCHVVTALHAGSLPGFVRPEASIAAALEHCQAELELRRSERDFARDLLERNSDLAEEAEELFELAAQGEQLATALEALDVELPPGFWLTSLVGSQSKDQDLSGDSKDELPVLQVQGRAQEGIEPNELVFQRLVGRLREQLPAYTIAEQMAPDGASFSLRMSLAAPLAEAADPELDADKEDA